jgi:hypothetical protein
MGLKPINTVFPETRCLRASLGHAFPQGEPNKSVNDTHIVIDVKVPSALPANVRDDSGHIDPSAHALGISLMDTGDSSVDLRLLHNDKWNCFLLKVCGCK